jgi:hypothetical protein
VPSSGEAHCGLSAGRSPAATAKRCGDGEGETTPWLGECEGGVRESEAGVS